MLCICFNLGMRNSGFTVRHLEDRKFMLLRIFRAPQCCMLLTEYIRKYEQFCTLIVSSVPFNSERVAACTLGLWEYCGFVDSDGHVCSQTCII